MASELSTDIISTAAVQTTNTSYVFYTNSGGTLFYLRSSGGSYLPKTPFINGQTVSGTPSSHIAAVSYKLDNDQPEIRVYYVGSGSLHEVIMNKDEEWRFGSLSDPVNKTQALDSSLLTASVYDVYGKGKVKIYYCQKEHDARLFCTWATLGDKNWNTEPITEE